MHVAPTENQIRRAVLWRVAIMAFLTGAFVVSMWPTLVRISQCM